MSIEKSAGRFNTWFEFFRNWKEIGEFFGITPKAIIAAVFWAILWAAGLIHGLIPWYFTVPASLAMLAAVLFLYAGIIKARSVQGMRKIKLDDVADACARFEERYWDFLDAHGTDLKEIAQVRNQWPLHDGNPHEVWNKERELEEALMRKMKARLGSDLAAIMAMFSTLGLSGESDFRSLHWSDIQARYYGAVGKLLKNGLLQEARKLDRHKLFF